MLPGQTPPAKPETTCDVDADGEVPDHLAAFNVLAQESKYRHLHQVSGWVDMDNKNVWDDYVADTMAGKLRSGDRVFEAGCGVLAFLQACLDIQNDLVLGGVDGAPRTIRLIKEKLVHESFRDNFFVGMLPHAMLKVPSDSWDVVVCNSVFQYFGSDEDAVASVWEMIRVAKRWVIIADVCDKLWETKTNDLKNSMEWTKGVPHYRCYSQDFWDQFAASGEHLVSRRHVNVKEYVRRKERYVVYIEKNAEVIQSGTKRHLDE
jgi:ubiquinone/menaquinone biosynthesis C-methylase UbiE